MLVVRVEVWPGGDEKRRREIDRIEIGNVSNLAPVSDYEVRRDRATAMVRGHERSAGAWLLIRRAMGVLGLGGARP